MVLRSCAASMPARSHLTTEPTLARCPAQEPTANEQVMPASGVLGLAAAQVSHAAIGAAVAVLCSVPRSHLRLAACRSGTLPHSHRVLHGLSR
eukprot:3684889-Prymnesium_polylepis.1